MNFTDGILKIENALMQPLPGERAQRLMAPALRKSTADLIKQSENYRMSSVMILLYPDAYHHLNTLFIERPDDNSIHSGQIAFPGGKMEESDKDLSETALRETEEETGIRSNDIKLLGALTNLFIPASNFLVHPFIGYMNHRPSFHPDPLEVKSLIPYKVSGLLSLNPQRTSVKTSYGTLQTPYFNIEGHTLWGATAMIVSEFRELINNSQ